MVTKETRSVYFMTAFNKSQTWVQLHTNLISPFNSSSNLFNSLYKELSHKGKLIFLNESNTLQKRQKTVQWMQINPEGTLNKMSSYKQNWLPTKNKLQCNSWLS